MAFYQKSVILSILCAVLAAAFSCKNSEQSTQSDLDIFILQIDKIYKNLVKDAKVEDISEEIYNKINAQEYKLSAGVTGSIKQKVVQGNLGVDIVYQRIETNNKKYYRTVSGVTDNDLQKKLAEIALVGLKCYDFSKKAMDEDCKRQSIEEILKPDSVTPAVVVVDPDKNSSTKKAPKTPESNIQEYSSIVQSTDGEGIEGVEIYCPNCEVKRTKTNKNGEFTLKGIFSPNDAFWQSTLSLSKDKKKIEITIDWRENAPEPLIF